jgi:ABC-2 type transport system ATP-binding protein
MKAVIQTDNLSKYFGPICAVNNVCLSVDKGEIYGFIGLNGAGKTTTIRMLLGMIRPTSGSAYLDGKKVHPDNHELWKKVGYMVEIPYSYPDLTVRKNLEIVRRLRLIEDAGAIDVVISKLELGKYQDRKANQLSLGNAQRLGLAKALLHNPEILLLDEPANGLDPAGIVEIREMLQDLAMNHGVTIFISSHILGEISKISSRIGIIHDGFLIQDMTIEQLHQMRHRSLLVNARNRDAAKKILIDNGYSINQTKEGNLELIDEQAFQKPDLISALLTEGGCPPTMIVTEEEDLESYFLRTITEKVV